MSAPTTVLSQVSSLHRFLRTASLICIALLCGCANQLEAEMQAYHARMHGLTIRNKALADEFLNIATKIQAENPAPDKVAQSWQNLVLPVANELRAEVADIQPDNAQLREIHSQIVSCWSDRADAYTSMLASFRSGDPEGFNTAMEKNKVSKAQEVSYFAAINALLQQYNLYLSQHP